MDEMTICDRCGEEIPVTDTSTGIWPDWDGATLCPDCWAEAEEEASHERIL